MATAPLDAPLPADGEFAATAVSTETALPEADPAPPPKVRLMCSAGGCILPRPTDGGLCYLGGETRIVVFDRTTSVAALRVRLAGTFSRHPHSFFIKYQLPSEDLDSLVSVCNEEDLENLLDEYYRLPPLVHADAKPSRIRLFIFPFVPKSILMDPPRPETWFIDALNDDWSARSAAVAAAAAVVKVQDMLSLDGQDVRSISSSPIQEAAASRSSSLESAHSYSLLSLPPIRVRADGELDLDPPLPPAPTYLLCNSSADAAVRPICKEGVTASAVKEVEANLGADAMESNLSSISEQLMYPEHQPQFILPGQQHAPVYYHFPNLLLQQQQLHALQMPMYLMPQQQQQLDNGCVNPEPMHNSRIYSTTQLPALAPVLHTTAGAVVHPKLQQVPTGSAGVQPILQQSVTVPVIDNGAPILRQSVPTSVINNAANVGVQHTMQQETLTPAIQNLVSVGVHPTFHLAAPIPVIDNAASSGGHSILQQVAPTPVSHNAAGPEVLPRLQQATPTPVTHNAANADVQLQPSLQQAVSTPVIRNNVNQGFSYEHLTYIPPPSQLMSEIASFTYVPISEANFQAYPMPVMLQPQYPMNGAPPVPAVHHPDTHQQLNTEVNRE